MNWELVLWESLPSSTYDGDNHSLGIFNLMLRGLELDRLHSREIDEQRIGDS